MASYNQELQLITSEADMVMLLAMRLCLAFFFISAAVRKLADQQRFIQGTLEYEILPPRVARSTATVLPWLELLFGIAMLLGVGLPVVGMATAVLVAAFIIAVYLNLRRGREIACNCYGIAGTVTISGGTLARNGLLLAMAIVVTVTSITSIHAEWLTPWPMVGGIPLSIPRLVVTGLLLGWLLSLVYLTEWAVDIHVRVSKLKMLKGG